MCEALNTESAVLEVFSENSALFPSYSLLVVYKFCRVEEELGIPRVSEWDSQVGVQGSFLRLELLKDDLGCCDRSELPGPAGRVRAEVAGCPSGTAERGTVCSTQ